MGHVTHIKKYTISFLSVGDAAEGNDDAAQLPPVRLPTARQYQGRLRGARANRSARGSPRRREAEPGKQLLINYLISIIYNN